MSTVIELRREVMIMDDNLMMIIMVLAVAVGGVAIGANRIKKNSRRLELKDIDEERAELLQEKYSKAVEDYNFIDRSIKSSSDKELIERLKRLQSIGNNILRQMQKEPNRILIASKFIDYYQDRTVRMINKFAELDETQLATDRVRELKTKIKDTLGGLEAAYSEQLERIVNDQMLSTEAELRVMEEHLRSEGLTKSNESKAVDDEQVFEEIPTQLGRKYPPRAARPDTREVSVIPDSERPAVIRQKMIQSALAIFLGTVGAHKFYLGKTWLGVLYFIFSWTTLPTWIGLLEGIRYLFMPIDDFYNQYVKDN